MAVTAWLALAEASQAALRDRALAARVRASLKADAATTHLEIEVRAANGQLHFEGVVVSDAEREAVLARARTVPDVTAVFDGIRIFRPPV